MEITKSEQSLSNAVGYAILAVDIDEKRSFLDYYIPMVAECIRISKSDYVNESIISEKLTENFSIKLPKHVVHATLKKLKKRNFLKFDPSLKIYKPNYTELEKSTFKQKQLKVLEDHSNLIVSLKSYLEINYDENLSNEQVEQAFEDYLNFSLKKVAFNNKSELGEHKIMYSISKFIKHLQDTHSPLFSYYESIFTGNMLATAVYHTEVDKYQQKFKDTKIFFDTTFIIYALGYAGENKKAPSLELINILKEQHASLRCFEHTIDEIKDILHGCITKVEQNIPDRWGTVSYFISKNYKKSDIQTLIGNLENKIEKELKIRIEEKPPYTPEIHNISEKDLAEYLEKRISYKNQSSLQRDIDSLHAVVRLRKGRKYSDVERSKAIFVTTNVRLSRVATEFFNNEDFNRFVSPILSDYILTTTQWIKNPKVHSTLPRKRIIADCLAAIQPTDRIIAKYMEKLEVMKSQGTLEEQDYLLLRSVQAQEILMGKTYGDEEALKNVDLNELTDLTLEMIRKKEVENSNQLQSELDELKKKQTSDEKAQFQKNKEQLKTQEALNQAKINDQNELKKKSLKISKIVHIVLGSIAVYILVWLEMSGDSFIKQSDNIFIKNIVWIGIVLLTILSILGFGLWQLIKASHNYLTKKIYNFLIPESLK